MYICDHFFIHELVPRHVYAERGAKAWELLDDRMLRLIDRLREKFGKMTINNWYWGGDREWSGLRTAGSPFYSPYSQHSFGRAFDAIFDEVGIETVRQYILNNPDEFPELMSLELDVSWLHGDVRNCVRIKAFKP